MTEQFDLNAKETMGHEESNMLNIKKNPEIYGIKLQLLLEFTSRS